MEVPSVCREKQVACDPMTRVEWIESYYGDRRDSRLAYWVQMLYFIRGMGMNYEEC